MEFEVLVDPDLALDFKKGKPMGIENILAVNEVFKDSRKGDRCSSKDLEKAFGTSDVFRVAERIIKEGDVQLTTEQRRKLIEEKTKEIATEIARQGIDPKTKLPHPITRILNAMREARVNIEPFRPAKEQIKSVVEAIEAIIPIAMERIEVAVRIPIEHAGKANAIIREITDVKKEEWTADSWIGIIEIPAGIQGDIYSRLNKLTGGNAQVKIIKEHKI
jgi:ribosome maturation protein SDO1